LSMKKWHSWSSSWTTTFAACRWTRWGPSCKDWCPCPWGPACWRPGEKQSWRNIGSCCRRKMRK
jgi:hypothetical protein